MSRGLTARVGIAGEALIDATGTVSPTSAPLLWAEQHEHPSCSSGSTVELRTGTGSTLSRVSDAQHEQLSSFGSDGAESSCQVLPYCRDKRQRAPVSCGCFNGGDVQHVSVQPSSSALLFGSLTSQQPVWQHIFEGMGKVVQREAQKFVSPTWDPETIASLGTCACADTLDNLYYV
jgi:hypothetical protein